MIDRQDIKIQNKDSEDNSEINNDELWRAVK